MVEIKFEKKTVSVPSRYKVEEETPDRLVLRAKKLGFLLGGGVLAVIGLGLLGVSIAVLSSEGTGLRVGLGIVGLLLLAGGAALVRLGIVNKDRIIFDRAERALRYDMTKEKDRLSVPFAEIEKVELRVESRSDSSGKYLMHQIHLLRKGGKELMLDEATNGDKMAELARKAAQLCGVQLADSRRL